MYYAEFKRGSSKGSLVMWGWLDAFYCPVRMFLVYFSQCCMLLFHPYVKSWVVINNVNRKRRMTINCEKFYIIIIWISSAVSINLFHIGIINFSISNGIILWESCRKVKNANISCLECARLYVVFLVIQLSQSKFG